MLYRKIILVLFLCLSIYFAETYLLHCQKKIQPLLIKVNTKPIIFYPEKNCISVSQLNKDLQILNAYDQIYFKDTESVIEVNVCSGSRCIKRKIAKIIEEKSAEKTLKREQNKQNAGKDKSNINNTINKTDVKKNTQVNNNYFKGYHDISINRDSSVSELVEMLSADLKTTYQVTVEYSNVNLSKSGVYPVYYLFDDQKVSVKVTVI